MKIIKCGLVILLFLFKEAAFTQPYSLIETESPYILKPFILETGLLLGYETGHIPDSFAQPGVNIGIFNWLQAGGAFTYTYFYNQDEWRISEFEIKTKARLLSFRKRDFGLFAYLKYRRSPGLPVIASYSGGLNGVLGVVSRRADQGVDYTGGLSSRFLIHGFKKSFFANSLGIMLGADYSRMEGRDYYTVSFPDEESYRNRIRFSAAPALFMGPSRRTGRGGLLKPVMKKNSVMFAVDNKITYWFKAGYMYDVIPQVNWSISKTSSVYGGVSVPILGGKVYKFYLGASSRFDLEWITANIKLSPSQFSPDGNGINDTLFIKPSVSSRHRIKRWRIVIYDPSGSPFRIFSGKGKPLKLIRWNGRSKKGEVVESVQKYRVKLEAWDVKGNFDRSWTKFQTDIMFHKNISRMILFGFNSARIVSKYTPMLDKLALLLLTRYKNYTVMILGHTCKIGGKRDNVKLSDKRARAIFRYLKKQGVSPGRIGFKGMGEKRPVSDNNSDTGRRKNRRADFILKKR